MPPKKPKDIPDKKLKCFTRTDKEGNKYVNCQDKTKMKAPAKKAPAKKAPAKAPAKKAPAKKKLKVVPKRASAKKAPPKKPSATFDMLRPEIKKNILGFAGKEKVNPSKFKKKDKDRFLQFLNNQNKFLEKMNDIETMPDFDYESKNFDKQMDRYYRMYQKDVLNFIMKPKYDGKTYRELLQIILNDFDLIYK